MRHIFFGHFGEGLSSLSSLHALSSGPFVAQCFQRAYWILMKSVGKFSSSDSIAVSMGILSVTCGMTKHQLTRKRWIWWDGCLSGPERLADTQFLPQENHHVGAMASGGYSIIGAKPCKVGKGMESILHTLFDSQSTGLDSVGFGYWRKNSNIICSRKVGWVATGDQIVDLGISSCRMVKRTMSKSRDRWVCGLMSSPCSGWCTLPHSCVLTTWGQLVDLWKLSAYGGKARGVYYILPFLVPYLNGTWTFWFCLVVEGRVGFESRESWKKDRKA